MTPVSAYLTRAVRPLPIALADYALNTGRGEEGRADIISRAIAHLSCQDALRTLRRIAERDALQQRLDYAHQVNKERHEAHEAWLSRDVSAVNAEYRRNEAATA